jgi:hypothetical protein
VDGGVDGEGFLELRQDVLLIVLKGVVIEVVICDTRRGGAGLSCLLAEIVEGVEGYGKV